MNRKKRSHAQGSQTDPVLDQAATEAVPLVEPLVTEAVESPPEPAPVVADLASTVVSDAPATARARRRPSLVLRFGIAFLIGLLAVMALGVGALFAYDQQYSGRVLPGVSVGDLDLSGMTETEATAALTTEYASLGEGSVVVTGPDGKVTFTFAELGRRPDIAGMTSAALAAGRSGNPAERAISNARVALRGLSLEPLVILDTEPSPSASRRWLPHSTAIRRRPPSPSTQSSSSSWCPAWSAGPPMRPPRPSRS